MVFNQNDRSCLAVESMDPCQREVARQREEAAQLRVKVMQDQRSVVSLEVKLLSHPTFFFTKQLRKGMILQD